MVLSEGLSVYRASRLLKIKGSTAKTIVRNYKKTGAIFQRKNERIEESVHEEIPEEATERTVQEERN